MLETIRRELDEGAIGAPTMLTANLGYLIDGFRGCSGRSLREARFWMWASIPSILPG